MDGADGADGANADGADGAEGAPLRKKAAIVGAAGRAGCFFAAGGMSHPRRSRSGAGVSNSEGPSEDIPAKKVESLWLPGQGYPYERDSWKYIYFEYRPKRDSATQPWSERRPR